MPTADCAQHGHGAARPVTSAAVSCFTPLSGRLRALRSASRGAAPSQPAIKRVTRTFPELVVGPAHKLSLRKRRSREHPSTAICQHSNPPTLHPSSHAATRPFLEGQVSGDVDIPPRHANRYSRRKSGCPPWPTSEQPDQPGSVHFRQGFLDALFLQRCVGAFQMQRRLPWNRRSAVLMDHAILHD